MTVTIPRKRAIVANYWKTFLEKRRSKSDDNDTMSDKDEGETGNGDDLNNEDANENIKSKWFRKGIMKSFIDDNVKYNNLRRQFDNDVEELTEEEV